MTIKAKLIQESDVQWSEVTVEVGEFTETFSVQLTSDGVFDTALHCRITINNEDRCVDFDDYPSISEREVIEAAEKSAEI